MANRAIVQSQKAELMSRCLRLRNVNKIAKEYGVTKQSIYNWFDQIIEHLPETLEKNKPGPKSNRKSAPPFLETR